MTRHTIKCEASEEFREALTAYCLRQGITVTDAVIYACAACYGLLATMDGIAAANRIQYAVASGHPYNGRLRAALKRVAEGKQYPFDRRDGLNPPAYVEKLLKT